MTKLSPMFEKRVDYELNRRIIQTYLNDDSIFWKGMKGQKVNNWNIWINTNVLMTSLLAVNQTQRKPVIDKIVKSADDWLNWYGDDGGCDEGPSYWRQAAARLIRNPIFPKISWPKNESFVMELR